MDPHSHAYKHALERLRNLRNRSENSAITVIRELIEDQKVQPDVAVSTVAVVFSLGFNLQGKLMDEAMRRYGHPAVRP